MKHGTVAWKLFGAFSLACILTLISQSGAFRPGAEAARGSSSAVFDPPSRPLPELEALVPAAFDESAKAQLEASRPPRAEDGRDDGKVEPKDGAKDDAKDDAKVDSKVEAKVEATRLKLR